MENVSIMPTMLRSEQYEKEAAGEVGEEDDGAGAAGGT